MHEKALTATLPALIFLQHAFSKSFSTVLSGLRKTRNCTSILAVPVTQKTAVIKPIRKNNSLATSQMNYCRHFKSPFPKAFYQQINIFFVLHSCFDVFPIRISATPRRSHCTGYGLQCLLQNFSLSFACSHCCIQRCWPQHITRTTEKLGWTF